MGERLARAEEWITGHEKRCEDRQAAIEGAISDLKGATAGLTKGAWGIVLALLGFMAVQLYTDMRRPAPAAVAIATPAPAQPHATP